MSSRARGRRNRGIKVLQAEKPLLVQKKNKSGGTKSEESKLSAAPSPSGDNICHVYKYWPRIRDGKPVEPEIYTVSVPAELDMVKLVIAPFPRVKRPDSDFVDDGSDVEPLLSLPEFEDFPTSSPDIFYGPP
ncbi:uncharacterized protein LOC112196571 isoform X5 [Rosa chinensis]|uniref:uncharacterized protein LOC112196571 isoform X5 n=1 Tax=Rosa chinensis TaxID=74649 RepID=UPI001AD8D31D|nr:uncharacterized protein LOC112196571 isoform X5 [Rosa chinensis]